mmetsp:Transcript_22264/g.46258  ORF Transcript_22264/g.46258 Transcript_22264/m.46258 type:complete len:521 (+) Transcript_22264:57-1619(+)|eukprot:CAMPEP_0118663924 /NCGR_PEP_ID=MMETSP0785-20121206/17717_1 /TAXON_ID=91992 /ORGANISM="Bolidomonas pacifica, Strain CCMP 1866" /LENGTH=520 /DNA_ID=CAMNT_0006557753 /DNA_START=23 /DNA_END=1585 /DNA_ORIENTATION=-
MTIKGIHSAASLAKLTAGRRAKIQKLADLEAERSKRSRLESLLSQKLVAKYGTRVKSETNRVIKKTVKAFLSGAAHISEADLRSVEVQVKQAIEAASITRSSEPETSFAAETEEDTGKKPSSSSAPTKTPLVLDPDDPKTNPWTVMDTLKAIEAEESLKADKIKLLADRKEMAKTLDEQMSIEGKHARRKKRENDAYLAQQQRMLNEWKREQQFADAILHEKNMQMRKIRQEQMDEKRARKMKEFKDNRAKELKDIEICKRELEKEKADAHEAKIVERKRLEKIKIANLEREKILEARRKADVEEDMRLAAEYIAKVDREQAARDKALEDRMSRYEEIGQQWADSGAGKRQREAELALERKILREAAAKEAADLERERRDLENLRLNGKMIKDTNLKMAADKARREKEQHDKDSIYATRFRREGEAFGAEEAARKAQEREKARKHCELLKLQIEEQKLLQKRVDMSETEMSLNRAQMDLILKDPVTGAKIMKKLSEKHTMKQSVAFKYKSNVPGLSHHEE